MTGAALVVQGNALHLPLPDGSVDMVCTSPPFWALRAYGAGPGEIGSEPTPQAFLEALWTATAEMARVLKPSGSMFVDLGDCYSSGNASPNGDYKGVPGRGTHRPGATSQWTNANAAWLAAVLDCEGSVSGRIFTSSSGNDSFVVWMRVGMMDPEVVERIYEITGVGKVFKDKRGCWNWHAASQAARYVLERIWPWLRIKQKRTLAAIELCRHVEERAARGFRTLTHNDLAYRAKLVQAIRDWNGHPARPNDYEPPRPPLIPLPDSLAVTPAKSLQLLPERYRIGCIDRLGLIARQVIIWNKPNSLPESVVDRPRRSHEDWVMLTKQPRYYSALDEVRESYSERVQERQTYAGRDIPPSKDYADRHDGNPARGILGFGHNGTNPLGKLPGSVWSIPSEPLRLPEHLGVQHYAAFPSEWPRRLILGFSPPGICLDCDQGRVPVVERAYPHDRSNKRPLPERLDRQGTIYSHTRPSMGDGQMSATILGYACSCTPHTDHSGSGESSGPQYSNPRSPLADGGSYPNHGISSEIGGPTSLANRPRVGPWREYHLDGWKPPPTRPSVVLDPFSGTGTTVMVARALGRIGVGIDLSRPYCRAARWRVKHDGAKAISRTNLERQGQLL